MKRRSFVAAGVPVLYGCATGRQAVQFKTIQIQDYAGTVYLPPLHSTLTLNIGDRMIATRRVAVLPSITVKSDTTSDARYNDKWILQTAIPSGQYTLIATDGAGGNYFRQPQGLIGRYIAADGKSTNSERPKHYGGIFISASGQAFTYVLWEGYTEPTMLTPAEHIALEKGTIEVDLPGEHLQKELIYLGLSQSTIVLRYREYWRGVAKPEFTLDVRYDLSQGRSIGYKDARFEIESADNTSIRFRTSAHLK